MDDRTTIRLAAGLAAAASIIGFGWLYWPAIAALVDSWFSSGSNSHGLLIFAVSAWLLWGALRRNRLSLDPTVWPILLLAAISVMLLAASTAGIQIVIQASIPLVLLGVFASLFGLKGVVVTAIPIGYLYFAIPVWNLMNGLLQKLTVVATTFMLEITGIPAFIQANTVTLPNGIFEIAAGCSGLHFFIVGLALGALNAILNRNRIQSIILQTAIFGIASAIGNWIRVFAIIVAGYLTDMQHFLVTVDHYYFGWLVFAIVMWLTFKLVPIVGGPPATDAAAVDERELARRVIPGTALMLAMALAIAPWFGPLLVRVLPDSADAQELPQILASSRTVASNTYESNWSPVFIGPDAEASHSIWDGVRHLETYAVAYFTAEQGRELIHASNRVLGSEQWRRIDEIREYLLDFDGLSGNAGRAIVESSDGTQRAVLYWYQAGSKAWVSGGKFKFYKALRLFAGQQPSVGVAISAECGVSCEAAESSLIKYLEEHQELFFGNSVATSRQE